MGVVAPSYDLTPGGVALLDVVPADNNGPTVRLLDWSGSPGDLATDGLF
jgi:hypothetical protein